MLAFSTSGAYYHLRDRIKPATNNAKVPSIKYSIGTHKVESAQNQGIVNTPNNFSKEGSITAGINIHRSLTSAYPYP